MMGEDGEEEEERQQRGSFFTRISREGRWTEARTILALRGKISRAALRAGYESSKGRIGREKAVASHANGMLASQWMEGQWVATAADKAAHPKSAAGWGGETRKTSMAKSMAGGAGPHSIEVQ